MPFGLFNSIDPCHVLCDRLGKVDLNKQELHIWILRTALGWLRFVSCFIARRIFEPTAFYLGYPPENAILQRLCSFLPG